MSQNISNMNQNSALLNQEIIRLKTCKNWHIKAITKVKEIEIKRSKKQKEKEDKRLKEDNLKSYMKMNSDKYARIINQEN